MGGRGASTNQEIDSKGNPISYGSKYHTVLQSGNIKFVKQNDTTKSVKTPMETQTKNRVYVTVNHQDEIKSITYYDKENKRKKQIDVKGKTHRIKGKPTIPHTHEGYEHIEQGTRNLATKEKKMVERIVKLWNNRASK